MAAARPFASRYRILIVEDEAFVAELMAEMVRELGYEIAGLAHSIPAAREELAKHDFDAVLLDIRLDTQHSYAIADLLLEMKIPFAFVSGYTRPFEPRHFRVPLLQKPFTLGSLRQVLIGIIGPAVTDRPSTKPQFPKAS